MDYTRLSIAEIQEGLRHKKFSCQEITAAHLKRIAQVEPKLKAFLTVAGEEALARAAGLDKELEAGEPLRPLTGVPIAIKDNICAKGIKTTCGSRILGNYVSPYSATVVERLEAAGAVIAGKTNCDEFGMGSSTENSAFAITANPFDLERVPGGSSGGSAASVAAYEAVGAFGSDTGGSVRTPAAFCGVFGLKPTYGRVSRYGLVAFSSSLDTIGPFARSAEDLAVLLQITAGYDALDMTSHPSIPEIYTTGLDTPLQSHRVGVPFSLIEEGVEAETRQAMQRAVDALKRQGCQVHEIELPHLQYAIATYYLIATSEASSNLARYDAVKYGYRAEEFTDLIDMYRKTRAKGFGAEVKRRIMLGTFALSSGYYDAYFLKASKVRTLLIQDFQKAFASVDTILMPITPTLAFRVGEKTSDPLAMYLTDVFTVSANLAGIPALSIPAGYSAENLPVAVQLLGNHFQEKTLLNVAWHLHREFQLPEAKLAV
ncbi:MAG TPA: Asp-tRNA(Asn)/Glu-tRNA(Gln) amidotransferase subunit GatA [Acidobacteriota bacterium]|jgi:aspartyl-tRNA(Asn)/glutamyl-tRNA(Gln) amidotransferase subunit A|nr:Asp-tRNA(Asn)/Glu-tRNA(Gln) amidotransferase subunit GatA [Acidobacteriota bacterium]